MYTSDLVDTAKKGFKTLWEDSVNRPTDVELLKTIHGIQRGLHCCGRTNANDWIGRPGGVPISCCVDGVTVCTNMNAFKPGCEETIGDIVAASGNLIAWIAIVFGVFEVRINFYNAIIFDVFVLQFVGVIFACCLASSIRNSRRLS